MEGLTIDNNNNDNIPEALRKSIETSEKLQEKFSPILEQEKKMQQLVEGVNIPKFEVSTQALDAMRKITDNSAMRIAQDNMNVMKSRALQMSPKINAAIASANNNAFKSIGELAIKSSLHNYQFDIPAIKILDDLGKNATANLISGLNNLVNNSAMREIQSITSRLGKWLQTIDFSPLTSILENIRAAGFDHDYREVNDVFLKAMFDAKWFPYAGWIASFRIVDEMLEILNSSRASKNRIKRIDRLIFSYYDKDEINNFKRSWRKMGLPSYMIRILVQAVQAYHRTLIDDETANAIEFYLIQNGYVDMKRKVTDKYRQEIKSGTVAELPDELKPMAEGIHTLIQSVYDDSILQDMFTDGHETKVKDNPLNDNFAKKEFQALWREINHKYAYTVEFDSDELIKKAIAHIDEKLFVSELQYTTTIGRQKAEMNEYEVERGASFTGEKTRTQALKHAETSRIKYDLIGKVAEGTTLTRKTVSAILQGIRADKLYMFKNNPEEFITKVIRLINEQKATMIVEHISYDTIEGEYDSTIFTAEKNTQSFDKAFLAKKAIQDYVFTDGSAEKSIERKFAEDLDAAAEVCVYAKLPRTFQIPTPVGNYSPDWAIAFYEGTVKHIFFVAETKGTMETLNLRPIEQAKISCAKKLFNEMSNSKVVYHDVDSYQSLLNIMNDPSLDKKVCE